jgi:cyclohexanecarboxyl-CoA dehydrogenase
MDFSFSDEQRLIAETVRSFARDELLPKYMFWDRNSEFPR